MNKNMIETIEPNNSICMICWTALAVIFGKWWISLFAALFMTVHKYCMVCDNCGKHSPSADTHNDALKKAKLAGWIHFEESNMDYCPECQQTCFKR